MHAMSISVYCGGRVHVAYRKHHVLALCQSLCKATAHNNQLTVEIEGIVPSAEKDTHNNNSISVGYHAKEDYLCGGYQLGACVRFAKFCTTTTIKLSRLKKNTNQFVTPHTIAIDQMALDH